MNVNIDPLLVWRAIAGVFSFIQIVGWYIILKWIASERRAVSHEMETKDERLMNNVREGFQRIEKESHEQKIEALEFQKDILIRQERSEAKQDEIEHSLASLTGKIDTLSLQMREDFGKVFDLIREQNRK